MLHRLLHSTALALTVAGTALADTAAAQDAIIDDSAVQPPPVEDTGITPEAAPADRQDVGVVEEPVAPPPAGTVIEVQEPTQDRADQLIGMAVTGGDGEKIGSATDLLIDDNKQVTGVVISVGGFLGIGAKSVAINWDEVEVRDNPNTGAKEMVINLTREQLEAAPAFKTTEDLEAERAAETMRNTDAGGGLMTE